MQFVKIHNGKFDNNLVGSKYMINGLINSIFTGIKDTNPNTTAIKAIQIVNSHVLLLLFLFIIFKPSLNRLLRWLKIRYLYIGMYKSGYRRI